MAYDSPTTINASNGIVEIFNYVNTVTDYWFSVMLLIAVYVLVFIGFYKAQDDIPGSFAVSGFVTFVFALLFWIGGAIPGIHFGVVIGIAILGVFILLMDRRT